MWHALGLVRCLNFYLVEKGLGLVWKQTFFLTGFFVYLYRHGKYLNQIPHFQDLSRLRGEPSVKSVKQPSPPFLVNPGALKTNEKLNYKTYLLHDGGWKSELRLTAAKEETWMWRRQLPRRAHVGERPLENKLKAEEAVKKKKKKQSCRGAKKATY